MKKRIVLTSLLAIVATCGAANATIEGTESAQVKANLETNFKIAPEKSDYTLTAPDGTESNLAEVFASDYTNFSATTSADGQNVTLNDGVLLNIAQGTVAADNYKYASKDADGVISMVAGDTVVTDLNKDYTSEYITTPITVSSATAAAPVIDLGTDASDAVYITGDGNYYLLRVGDEILLNGDASVTADNPATYNNLLSAYNADVAALDTLHANLVDFKNHNDANAAAVGVAVIADNAAINNIVSNQATFTDTNAQYTSDAAENTAYVNSLASAIDTSIAAGTETAKAYADSLASNYDAAGAATTAETNAKEYADSLATNYDAAGAAATAETNAKDYSDANLVTAKDYADSGDATTLASAKEYSDANLVTAKDYADSGDATTLASAKDYSDANLVTAKDYADSGDATTLASAKEYSDANLVTAKDYADSRDAETLANANSYTDLALNSAKEYSDAGNALTLHQANAYTDERIAKLDKDLSAGIASSAALSSVAVSGVSKGELSVGAGFGHHNSQSAAAFGAVMGLTDRWSVNAGAGFSNADVTVRAGTNYKFKLF